MNPGHLRHRQRFTRLWRVYPPLEGLSASGGRVNLEPIRLAITYFLPNTKYETPNIWFKKQLLGAKGLASAMKIHHGSGICLFNDFC